MPTLNTAARTMSDSIDLPTLELASWDAFLSQVAQVGWGLPTQPGHVFRGHSDAEWLLEPGLLRILKDITRPNLAIGLEKRLEQEFFSQAHLTSSVAGMLRDQQADWLDRLALMQHHGAPTRLLDWTTSPMVAAYFACVELPDRDGAIVLASPVIVNRVWREKVGEEELDEQLATRSAGREGFVSFFYPTKRSDRQVAQQGHFSVSMDLLSAHDQGLARCLRPGVGPSGPSVIAAKWIVPRAQKLKFLGALRQMNVAGHSLFPGTDGLGRSLREAAMVERTMML